MNLSAIFSDNMVLAANKPTRIFGDGVGEVSVEFLGKKYFVPPNIIVSGIPTLALSKSGSRSKVAPSSQPVYKLPFIYL